MQQEPVLSSKCGQHRVDSQRRRLNTDLLATSNRVTDKKSVFVLRAYLLVNCQLAEVCGDYSNREINCIITIFWVVFFLSLNATPTLLLLLFLLVLIAVVHMHVQTNVY